MHRFIARANIDNYISLLNADVLLNPEKRSTIIKLLIAEEDKLSHDVEQLEFAETRAANGRERLKKIRHLRDNAEPAIRDNAERLVANVEATQQLVEDFCRQLRAKVRSSPL
jgi:hypothetical protein